ncbi:hypothetical protein NQ314_021459 [Rhamnusium bicolor]|uniref:Uncharacterized protein n=1 Tax=Rhamnusium bicolor TaxID=1586634 RepID=A0AAV8WII4_9CUCU|nr:hypothetical protein NQ314_021459 [Rhamnusium bicolor]
METAIPNTQGAQWLKDWSKSVNQNEENEALPLKPRPGLAIGEIDAKSVIPDDSTLLAQEMKKKKLEQIRIVVSTEKPKTTTSKEDALDNVDLE